jgi:crotonobetainyl-CoA:carnitine CoA-transferase CaiB-like acyl-CoA transferase
MLGDFGAEVIRVEAPDADQAAQDLGCSKLSVSLDFASPQGRDLCMQIAAACNFVFLDAESALDYDAIAAARPSAIVIVVEGDTPEVGIAAAGAALTALFHHRETGEGQRIDVTQDAVVANLRSIAILAAGLKATSAPATASAGSNLVTSSAATEPVAGPGGDVREVLSLPYRLSRTPLHVRLPAPRPGEHTDYVLRAVAGLSWDEVEALRAAGVVGARRSGAQ